MQKLNFVQLRALPKIDLHRHLDCSMRWSTMVDIAKTLKIELPATQQQLTETFLITDQMIDLSAVLRKFLNAQKLLASTEILTRLAYEACEDAYNDGVLAVELRYAPTFIHEGHSHLSFEKIHRAFLEGLALAEKKLPIVAGLICIVQRIKPLDLAEQVIDFAIDHKETFIGLDLADDETHHPASLFASVFAKARTQGMKITIHSGEIPHSQAGDWIRSSVEVLGAQRIGHGVQVIHHPEVMDFLRKNKITLEVCPYSNHLTRAFSSLQEHPVRRLYDQKIPMAICSDDPGIFHSKLSDDYEIVQSLHGFNLEDFKQVNRMAFEASFLNPEKLKKVWKEV